MHPTIHIRGEIRWHGKQSVVEEWLKKWRFRPILVENTSSHVTLDGAIPLGKEGPNGRVNSSLVQDSLEELATQVEILQAHVRCRPSYPNDDHDIILLNHKFVEIDLELQPTLRMLDDPAVSDYYGLDYCLSETIQ